MDDEINFQDYYYMLKKNILLILLIFVVIFLLSLAYTFRMTPIYQARSVVTISTQDQTTALITSTVQAQKLDPETQRAIMLSENVYGKVFTELGGAFDLEVNVIKNSNLIEIITTSASPEIAQKSAQAVAQTYIDYVLQTKKEDSLEVSKLIETQLQTYNDELNSLNTRIAGFNITKATNEQKLEYQNIEEQISAKEKLYSYLLSKKEEIAILSQQDMSNIKIVENAQMPLLPIKPNKPLYVLLGFFLAAMGAVAIAIIKESVSDKFTSTYDAEKTLGMKVFGKIPSKGEYLSVYHHAKSDFVHSIKMLRTNLLFFIKDHHVICITSPQKGDGKTMIAANLAVSFSQLNKKVLIIDTNIREPKLKAIFGRNEDVNGLGELLSGKSSLTDVIRKPRPEKGKAPDLNIIYAGSLRENPSELLSSHKLNDVMAEVKKHYDVIILDAPSVHNPETPILCSLSDAVLLVVSLGKTKKSSLNHSGIKADGVIVNFAG